VKGPGYDAIKGDNAQLVFAVASLCFSNSVENIFFLLQVDFNWRSFSSLPMRHISQVPYTPLMSLSQALTACWQITRKIVLYFWRKLLHFQLVVNIREPPHLFCVYT
jgi:hypothetical protein